MRVHSHAKTHIKSEIGCIFFSSCFAVSVAFVLVVGGNGVGGQQYIELINETTFCQTNVIFHT